MFSGPTSDDSYPNSTYLGVVVGHCPSQPHTQIGPSTERKPVGPRALHTCRVPLPSPTHDTRSLGHGQGPILGLLGDVPEDGRGRNFRTKVKGTLWSERFEIPSDREDRAGGGGETHGRVQETSGVQDESPDVGRTTGGG